MPRQLLLYEQVKQISKTKHRNWSVKTGDNYDYAKSNNFVPITAIEFPSIARDYSIVFTGKGESLVPIAVMGVRENENLYISSEGKIDARYVPAFLRRYPFIFSSNTDSNTLTLCIDESFTGCNQENIGERLFDANGEQTLYLKKVLGFLNEYQLHFNLTKAFCKKLEEFGLLEPMSAQIKPAKGSNIVVTGFLTVNKRKLKALSSEQLQSLIKTDEMELIYLHLQSLRNLDRFAGKIENSSEQQPEN